MARALATATITFGLVAIPVKVYVSASSEAVAFNQINPTTGNRVKQKLVDAVTGDELDRAALSKGYEYTKGQFVTFTEDELKALESVTTKTVDVQEFVPVDSIDPIAIEKTYFLGPDKGGDKGYALLTETLASTGTVAVAQWSNRGRVHLVTLTAHAGGLVMRLMYYASETRDFAEVLDNVAKLTISEPERAMAGQLVAALSKPAYDPARYADTYAVAVRKAADEKAASGGFTVAAAAPNAVVLDLFEALKKSLADATKPSEPEPAPAAGPVKAKGKRGKKTEAA